MTSPTVPSPAQIPRAGLSLPERLRRQEAAQDAAATLLVGAPPVPPELLAPPGELERLAAEQGVQPVTDIDDLAAPLRDRLTDEEFDAFQAAMRDDEPEPITQPAPGAHPVPHPPFAWVPGAARQPNPMARDQYIRRGALDLAVRHFQDLEVEPAEVLATAKAWAEWIRVGDKGAGA